MKKNNLKKYGLIVVGIFLLAAIIHIAANSSSYADTPKSGYLTRTTSQL